MNRETVTQPRPESLNEPFVPAISIDRDFAIPLYQQICQPLSELIGSGWLVPGQLIEDEVAMANRLRVSRPTARRALEELVNRGLVIRRRRVGTRVAPRHVHRPLGLTSLYDDLKESGYEIRSEVLSYEVLLAKESQSAHLNTAVGSEIVQIRRLRFIDDAPLALMNNLIPFDVAPSFSELNEQGLYACMRKRGVNPYSAEQSIGARLTGRSDADLLNVDTGSALVTMQRTTYDHTGRVIEFGDHVYVSSLYSYRLQLFV